MFRFVGTDACSSPAKVQLLVCYVVISNYIYSGSDATTRIYVVILQTYELTCLDVAAARLGYHRAPLLQNWHGFKSWTVQIQHVLD